MTFSPPRPPSKVGTWAVLAIIPLVAAGLAWLLAGHWLWSVPGAVGVIFTVYAAFGALRRGRFVNPAAWPIIGYVAFVLVIWFGVGYAFQVGKVHVDNYSNQELRVLVDGTEWQKSRPGTTTLRNLTPGSHRITVLDRDDKHLQELNVQVERQGVYILNLLRAEKYHRGSVQYGGMVFGDNLVVEINDTWFEPKVDYLFQHPPQTITVSTRRGQAAGSTSRSYLLRGPAPKR